MPSFSQSRFSLPTHEQMVTESYVGNHGPKQSFIYFQSCCLLLHPKLLCSSHTYFIHSLWVPFCLLYLSPTKMLACNKNISQIYRSYC